MKLVADYMSVQYNTKLLGFADIHDEASHRLIFPRTEAMGVLGSSIHGQLAQLYGQVDDYIS